MKILSEMKESGFFLGGTTDSQGRQNSLKSRFKTVLQLEQKLRGPFFLQAQLLGAGTAL